MKIYVQLTGWVSTRISKESQHFHCETHFKTSRRLKDKKAAQECAANMRLTRSTCFRNAALVRVTRSSVDRPLVVSASIGRAARLETFHHPRLKTTPAADWALQNRKTRFITETPCMESDVMEQGADQHHAKSLRNSCRQFSFSL